MNEPIAIIGMSCRFPKANNVDAFWQLLVNGVDAISEVPRNRFDLERYYDSRPATPGKVATRFGGFLDDIEEFDATFFGISPREAQAMDPQQRLLLEVAWEALEDAGQVPKKLAGSNTGVFVGMWTNEYEDRMYDSVEDINLYVTTGGGRYAASGRLSYFFNFNGPSLTLDTACSSSLVATHLAVQSLRDGESKMALVGAVNMILTPDITIGYSRSGMLSPDGRCKFGDASANGYVRSEGAGVILLKPLSQALADGDPIHALIRGSAVNNDGRSSELLVAPSSDTQALMLRDAYRVAGVNPADVQYVEAHGTGTRVGDPVELTALGSVMSEGRLSDRPCLIGSVKTNIGHTEAASGMAGLIKAILCLKHRQIPPSLHLHEPNPAIPWDYPLTIPQQLTDWPGDASRMAYAGVNSFGVTGTNAHIVLEEAPRQEPHPIKRPRETYLLPLSARQEHALVDVARQYLELDERISLHDLAYTASTRHPHHDQRLAMVVRSQDDLREQLTAYANGENGLNAKPHVDAHKIAFVFSGQGGQWVGMGRQLMEQEPVFRAALGQCDAAMRPFVNWSLMDVLSAGESLDEIDVIQPVIFAVQMGLAALWRSWGVEPDAVIGHSMGEVAAACVAGVLSLEDAAHVICRRSQLMKRVSGKGTMALVELTYAEAEKVVAESGSDQVGVAVSNGPTSTVLSGDPVALQAIVSQLESQDVFCRFVNVDVAAHSPHMDKLRPLLVQDLGKLQASAGDVPIYSTVEGELLAGEAFSADYWGSNLRQPVRFALAVENALADGLNTFIEMSPHPVLLPAIERGYASEFSLTTLASMRREQDERATMLESLGALYTGGYEVDWNRLYPEGGNIVPLPAYPWQKERYWFAEEAGQDVRRAAIARGSASGHPLLGDQMLRAHDGSSYWETVIDLAALPYLVDHQVQRRVVLPAAAYLEIALAAARDALGDGLHQLRDVTLHEALFLSADEATVLQVVLSPQMTFEIYSQQSDSWVLHVSGTVFTDREGQTPDSEIDVVMTAQTQLEQPDSRVDGSVHYGLMAQRALHYGPAFQGINAFTLDGDEGAARVTLPDHANRYQLHPAFLDAAFQLLLEKLPDTNQDTYLPVELDMLAFYSQPEQGHEIYALAQWTAITDSDLTGDARLVDETGRTLAAVYGLRMKRVTRESTLLHEGIYQVAWTPAEIDPAAQAEIDGSWLVFADTQGVGIALVEHLNDVGSRTAVVFAGDAFAEATDSWTVNPTSEADFDALLAALDADFISNCRGVAFLWPLDADTDQLPDAAYSGVISALYLSRMLSRAGLSLPVWLITRGAQAIEGPLTAPAQSSLWGLGAVMSNEYADLQPVRIDLDPMQIDIQALVRELTLAGGEDQIAYRGSQRYVARLEPFAVDEAADESAVTLVSPEEQPFRAEVTVPGVLDNLRLGAMSRLNPAEGEVEIEVHATGLNFMNVMAALGVLPGYDDGVGPLGIECAGRVVQVGDGVDEWQVGDEVVAIAFNSLATHAVTDAHLVARKPEHLSFAEAATIPIVFLTAYYALHDLARMQRGERVLIHSGAGGVGLAAIQLVQLAGAEAWATVGNDEKREYLHQLGVQHVMNSHSLAFADDVLTATDGEGVDIVLNSLAGTAIARGLAILRPYGRFVEIGKRDIYGNTPMGLQPFSRNLSYFAVDLDKMARERPDKVGAMLREIMALVENDDLQPLPLQTFPAAQVADAFRFMAQGKHIGKIVILPREGESPVHIPAGAKVRADGSYLITGGLGGLGLTVAHWLASQGAGQIVLVGRRAPDAFATEHIEAMRAAGADVRTVQADVTDADSVAQLMQAIQHDMLPLRGVFHAAGLLDDGLMEQLDAPRFHKVMSPKVEGAWHLHQMTLDAELDWFVLFSSVSALLGIPGQANYAAGNAFMDGLAHYRRTMELPALSVNWGPWADIGLAAAQTNRGERLTTRGLGSIAPQDGIRALETLLAQATTQVTVMTFDANQWAQVYPTANQSSLLKELIGEIGQAPEAAAAKSSESIRDRLMAVESDAARMSLLQDHIREQVGAVLGLATPRVDVNKPLRNQGLDSLMTLEMRNRLEASLGLKLSATLVFNYPSVVALTKYLAEKLDLVKTATATATAAPEPVQEQIDDFEELSQEEVEAMLAEELASLDDLLKGE